MLSLFLLIILDLILVLCLIIIDWIYVQEGLKMPFDITIIVSGLIIMPFGTLLIYLLKRQFLKKDLEFEKELEHEKWLSQQLTFLVPKFYSPLTKYAMNYYNEMECTDKSKNNQSIKTAYYHICLFFSKYISFKNEQGANFILLNRDYEEQVINTITAILRYVPFEYMNIISIHNFTENKIFDQENFSGEIFEKFNSWVKSENCDKSKKLVNEKMLYLKSILDHESEIIIHPKLKNKSNPIEKPKLKDDNIFYILYSSVKSSKRGKKVQIYGGGFTHNKVEYDFYIGDTRIEIDKDDVVELSIPMNFDLGTFDIYSKFTVNRGGRKYNDTTIGIPIYINK